MGYCRDVLGIEPWAGRNGNKGQLELFQDIGESVRRQLAGLPATKIFRVEAGHGVGKTFGAAALVSWFFDCFVPSMTMTTAPTSDQVEKLLWKDIRTQREGKGLPGTLPPSAPQIVSAANHMAYGRTTNNSGGQGTSRVQGQHNKFQLQVLDEAEGVEEFFFDAVNAMMTGGVVQICLAIANPLTRSSPFAKLGKRRGVGNYRLSVLDFPNVVDGRSTIPGGTERGWVNAMIEKCCEVVASPDEDNHTFSVHWDVTTDDGEVLFTAGTVFQPDAEFMFRVMGIAPKNISSNTLITVGRYESATKREAIASDVGLVRYGVDVARDGDDVGTVYRAWKGVIKRIGRLSKLKTEDYLGLLKDDMKKCSAAGAMSIHVRVDGGGGFGGGLVDGLRVDVDLQDLVPDFQVFEVHNGGTAYDETAYADVVTELYAEAAEALKALRLESPPEELERDLTERTYSWVHKNGRAVKKLEPKPGFKKRIKRSPDDGDGLVLAAAPVHIFGRMEVVSEGAVTSFDLDEYDHWAS